MRWQSFVVGVGALIVAVGAAPSIPLWLGVPILLGGAALVGLSFLSAHRSSLHEHATAAVPTMGCYRTAGERAETAADDGPRLAPFALVDDRTRCPKCQHSYNTGGGVKSGRLCWGGLRWPRACHVRGGHFHVRCTACGARWLMATADAEGQS